MSRGPGSAGHPPPPIRLVLVEPRVLLAAAVRDFLDREPDIEVIASVRSAEDAGPVIDESSPDVILVSGQAAETSTVEATMRLRQRAPHSTLVVLGGEDDDASMVEAVEIGAAARIAEVAEPGEIVEMIREVAQGARPLNDQLRARPDLLEHVLDSIREAMLSGDPPTNPLSDREVEVLGLVALGMRNTQIADRLGLSSQTVKNHLSAILHKLGVQNRTRAVTYAARHGWLGIDEEALQPK